MANRSSLSRSPKNRGPFHRVPVVAKATLEAPGARGRKGDLGETVIGLAIPRKAIGHHHHPLRLAVPLPDQNCSRSQFSPLLVEAYQPRGYCRTGLLCACAIQHLLGLMIEVAKAFGLNPIGDDRKQQMPRQMIGRWSLKHTQPTCAKSLAAFFTRSIE